MSNELGVSPANAENSLPADANADADAKPEVEAEPAPAVAKPDVAPEDKIQKRFDKLTREKYEALRERDRLNWELEQLKQSPAKSPPVAQEPPTLESSGFDEKAYQAELRKFYVEQAKEEARAEARKLIDEERQQTQAKARESEFEQRQNDFIKSKPDYRERVIDNPDLPITQAMAEIIRASEIGPQIAYHLAEHEDIAAQIAQLPPALQAREIGRLEARLESQKAPPKPQVSQAPPPAAKLDATDANVAIKPDSAESDTAWSAEEWAKRRNKQLARRK